jgi:hypothetical protein
MLSVIICTHNPRADYFRLCLDALKVQKLPNDCWELLVVDNRSDEMVAGHVDLSWHPTGRIVREGTMGLTAARIRGIHESIGELLVFVDDDNVLDPDFLEVATRTMDEKPFLGSWSGQCRPEFETPPPEWTRRYWGNLVIREFERDVWSNLPRLPESMPCGAGLCVRREVALHYVDLHESGKRPFQFDRNGKSLLSGGDNDLAACACDIGLGVGLIASLRLTHLISPERLTEDYLVRLCEGIFCSAVVLDHFRSAAGAASLYKIHWHEPVRALLSRGPHRKIQFACLRGRRRGLELIDSLN